MQSILKSERFVLESRELSRHVYCVSVMHRICRGNQKIWDSSDLRLEISQFAIIARDLGPL
jgi:hypothetical protein